MKELAEKLAKATYGKTAFVADCQGDVAVFASAHPYEGSYEVVRPVQLSKAIRQMVHALRVKHERERLLLDEASMALSRAEANNS